MKPLHKIEKELTTPLLSSLEQKALAAFQRLYGNGYQLLIVIRKNKTYTIYYQSIVSKFEWETTRAGILSYASDYTDTDKINWDTIIIRRL